MFINPIDKREEAKSAKDPFNTANSDWLTALQIYNQWSTKSHREQASFCEQNFVSMSVLNEIAKSRVQYLEVLESLGYLDNIQSDSVNENSENIKIIKSALVAGLYPNIIQIKQPDQKYVETANGVVQVDSEASKFKFYDSIERVFIHPTSVNFGLTNFRDPFLVYSQKVQTGKVYVRDTTSVSSWAVLLFGGKLVIDHHLNTLKMDGHLKIEAFPRIGALVHGMRALLDQELELKISETSRNILQTPVGKLFIKILSTDGLKS
jgi:ATP-dependent RNA helicase DHX57